MLQKCLSALHSDLRGPRFGSVWPRFEGPDRSNPRFKLNEQSSVRISVRIGWYVREVALHSVLFVRDIVKA